MSDCKHCGSKRYPTQVLDPATMQLVTQCVDCNARLEADTIPAAPPPPKLPSVRVVSDALDIVSLAKQRLAEIDAKLAQYDALISERAKLAKMLEAVEE